MIEKRSDSLKTDMGQKSKDATKATPLATLYNSFIKELYTFSEILGYSIVAFIKKFLGYIAVLFSFVTGVVKKIRHSAEHNLKVFIVRNGFDLEEVTKRYQTIKEDNALAL